MRATIVVELEEEKALAYLASLFEPGEERPDPFEFFREQVEGLVDDELRVAAMYGPGMRFRVGGVQR